MLRQRALRGGALETCAIGIECNVYQQISISAALPWLPVELLDLADYYIAADSAERPSFVLQVDCYDAVPRPYRQQTSITRRQKRAP